MDSGKGRNSRGLLVAGLAPGEVLLPLALILV